MTKESEHYETLEEELQVILDTLKHLLKYVCRVIQRTEIRKIIAAQKEQETNR